MTVRRSLPADELAPGAARGALKRLPLEADLLQRGELAISEVVTNCVRHAGLTRGQPIVLALALAPELLRVEVIDQGAGFKPFTPSRPPGGGPGGWGLLLVEALADRWGRDDGHSNLVWCEFDRTL